MNRNTSISIILILIVFVAMFEVNVFNKFAAGLSPDGFQKWVISTDDTVYDLVVSDNFVYFTSGNSEGFPSTLFCLNAETGDQVWNYSAASIYFTIAENRVYIKQSIKYMPSMEGVLLCLDAATGAELWHNDLNRHVNSFLLVGDCLYVADDNSVYTLDAKTGKINWEYSAAEDTSFRALSVEEGYVCCVSLTDSKETNARSSRIYVLNSSSGKEIWSQQIWSYTASAAYFPSVNITNGKCIVSYKVYTNVAQGVGSGAILAFDIPNGTSLWKYTTIGAINDFIVTRGIVYSATNEGSVTAVNASNGNEIWSYKDNSLFGSVFIIDKYLYASSTAGVSCFTLRGDEIWSYKASDYNQKPTDGRSVLDLSPTNPAYADGIIYFGWNGPQARLDTTEHNFYALNAQTGTVIWEIPLYYSIKTTPSVANDTLYIGGSGVTNRSPTWTEDGTVVTLDLTAMSFATFLKNDLPIAIVCVVILVAIAAVFIIRKMKKKKVKN